MGWPAGSRPRHPAAVVQSSEPGSITLTDVAGAGGGDAVMRKLTLIGLPSCPFVQQAIIALREKHVEHGVAYVDLDR